MKWQNGLDTKVEKSRKQMKERKNRAKKIRGVKKVGRFYFLCEKIEMRLCFILLMMLTIFPPSTFGSE